MEKTCNKDKKQIFVYQYKEKNMDSFSQQKQTEPTMDLLFLYKNKKNHTKIGGHYGTKRTVKAIQAVD